MRIIEWWGKVFYHFNPWHWRFADRDSRISNNEEKRLSDEEFRTTMARLKSEWEAIEERRKYSKMRKDLKMRHDKLRHPYSIWIRKRGKN